jgi:hypothetical protein
MDSYYSYIYLIIWDCKHANGNPPVFQPIESVGTKAWRADKCCSGSLLFANTNLTSKYASSIHHMSHF